MRGYMQQTEGLTHQPQCLLHDIIKVVECVEFVYRGTFVGEGLHFGPQLFLDTL